MAGEKGEGRWVIPRLLSFPFATVDVPPETPHLLPRAAVQLRRGRFRVIDFPRGS
jgi:hypothetical protein